MSEPSASERTCYSDGITADAFQCCICCDLLVNPVVFPCGHDSCACCFNAWIQTCMERGVHPACPQCRAQLPPSLGVCHRLRTAVECLHPEESSQRKDETTLGACTGYPIPEEYSSIYAASVWACWMSMSQMASMIQPGQHVTSPSPHPGATSHLQGAAPASGPQWGSALTAYRGQLMEAMDLTPHVVDPTDRLSQTEGPANTTQGVSRVEDGVPEGGLRSRERYPRAESGRWQSANDAPMRLEVARSILKVLTPAGGGSLSKDRLLASVRLLELELYRKSPSRSVYRDASTLASRVVAIIQNRSRRKNH